MTTTSPEIFPPSAGKNETLSAGATPTVARLAYNAKEACAALGGVSATSLWRWEKRGLLKTIPGVRHKLYSLETLQRFVAGKAGV